MHAYENKTQHTLYKTIDDEPMCVCACVLWIPITKGKILPFSNYNLGIRNLLLKIRSKPKTLWQHTELKSTFCGA
jgi:hypothetical protein